VILCIVAVGGRLRVCSVERRAFPIHIRDCLHLPRSLSGIGYRLNDYMYEK